MPPILSPNKLPVPVLHDYFHKHGRLAVQDTLGRLRAARFRAVSECEVTAWWSPEPLPFVDRLQGERLSLRPGEAWGGLFDCAWFRLCSPIPDGGLTGAHVLLVDLNGEGCVFDHRGLPVQGITCGSSVFDRSLGEPLKEVVRELGKFVTGDQLEVWIDAGCNDLFGNLQQNGTLKHAVLAEERRDVGDLYYDWEVLLDLLSILPQDGARFHKVLGALFEATLQLGEINQATVQRAREILAPELSRGQSSPPMRAVASGHAHIDLAWLWPIRETRRKAVRTVSTVVRIMERYPEYHFSASQPQLYQWIKQDAPSLYEDIRRLVREGRWEPVGAFWVEGDTNLPSGESLVRQILYGTRFFNEEFGVSPKCAFIPDNFGYSAALPQILAKAGIPYLVTIKMSWDQYAAHPFHTFNWEGPDGSAILVHMPPEGDYNSAALPSSFARAEQNYAEKALCDDFLVLYGIGDGGGGPGEEHLERLSRLKNLAPLPPVRQQSTTLLLDSLAVLRTSLPTWRGEMLLRRHQGTYTTQGNVKRFNRLLERMLRELEFLIVLKHPVAAPEPLRDRLREIWQEVLLYQFHDILPGSSIARVYKECAERYEALVAEVVALRSELLGASLREESAILVNSLPWNRKEWVETEEGWKRVHLPPFAIGRVSDHLESEEPPPPQVREDYIENEFLRVRFSDSGFIASLFDVTSGRELIPEGLEANLLSVYHDQGDAWDFPRHLHRQQVGRMKLRSRSGRVEGPHAIMSMEFTFGSSLLKQDVVLTSGSRVLNFRTMVDWRDPRRMVRAVFPVDLVAPRATSEIQFGAIERSTHENTAADIGEYETWAHKWVDLSESGYGVALLNDAKHGHRVKGHTIELTLLRTPSFPDDAADIGTQEFGYALYPHQGDWRQSGVVQRGWEYNTPTIIRALMQAGEGIARFPIAPTDMGTAAVEAIKPAEDGNGFILRMYESQGNDTMASFQMLDSGLGISPCSLVEGSPEDQVDLTHEGGSLSIRLRPWQIVSLRIAPRKSSAPTDSEEAGDG